MRLIPVLLAFAWPAWAQFSGLSTTGDGSLLFFSSQFRLRGSAQSFDAKLFVTSGQVPTLFRAQDRGQSMGWYFENFYQLVAPQVASDGSVVAFTGVRPCYGGSGCLSVQTAQGSLIDRSGKTILSALGYVNISPNGQYALFFGRNTFGHLVPPAELISVSSGTRVTVPYSIGLQARRRVANDGTVALFANGAIRLWRSTGEEAIAGLPVAAGADGGEPLLFLGADARRIVYQTAQGLARYDRTLIAGEVLAPRVPLSVAIDDEATVVAYIDPADRQIYVAAPARQLTREPEGIAEVALSGNGRVAFAVTRNQRILRIDVASGAVSEIVPRTPLIAAALVPGLLDYISDGVAPGSMIPLNGAALSGGTEAAAPPLPRKLADVRVRIAGLDAPLQFVSPELVWMQVPWEVPEQEAAAFEFLSGDSPFETGPGTLRVRRWAPHPFATADASTGYEIAYVAVHQDWSALITPENPARPGEIVTIYFNGLGPVAPAVATGEAGPAANPAAVTGPFQCRSGFGTDWSELRVYFAGLAPGMVGIDQVTLEIPAATPGGLTHISCGFSPDAYATGAVYVRAP